MTDGLRVRRSRDRRPVRRSFDKDPPRYASGFQYQTDPSTYDVIGRYFYIGARARF